MTRQERLMMAALVVERNFLDVHDLVEMLELTVDDLVYKFPDKLLENFEKLTHETDDGDYQTDEELDAESEWAIKLEEAYQATYDPDELGI